ncbi:carbohydrate porin, partial [Photobacterium sp. OFAV2-7]|uniref:carbohydrate porin n=1 Tax=Photobacterium sp. OFAV2-7 TaxID=2917748 RepID=UPI001EF4264C
MKLKKVASALSLALIVMPLTSQAESVVSNDLFGFSGYMRTGGGLNASGQNVNKLDEHHLGRFGNEFDTYIAAAFTKDLEFDNGLWAYYHLEFNRWDGDLHKSGASDQNSSDGYGDSGDWENDRNYLKMGGFDFLPEGSNIWVGSRKQEADFHILDYKWRRLMGTGIGYESKNFDIQFLQNDSGAETSWHWHGDVASHALAARMRQGKLEAEVMYIDVADFNDVDLEAQGIAESSVQLTVNYGFDSYYGLTDGYSKIVAQYGKGVTEDHLGWNESLSANEDDTAYKIAFDGLFSPSQDLDINPVFLYESFEADAWDNTETHLTVAVRLHKTISQAFAWVAEGAISDFNNEGGDDAADGIKYKLAVGPSFQMDAGYWARPVSRITLTYLGVDDELTGGKGINDDGDDSEFRLGYEFE